MAGHQVKLPDDGMGLALEPDCLHKPNQKAHNSPTPKHPQQQPQEQQKEKWTGIPVLAMNGAVPRGRLAAQH